MIVDYHMHLRAPDESLDHTVEGVERFVEAAAARGLDEIGFTEHVYYFAQTRLALDVPYSARAAARTTSSGTSTPSSRRGAAMPVKLGLEVDYLPGSEEETAALLAPYPWDYVCSARCTIDGDAESTASPG